MPFVTTKQMLLDAQQGKYAIGAFNVENMEMVMAVADAAEELNLPAIVQTTPSTVKYGGLHMYAALVRAQAEKSRAGIAMHLDHGSSVELVERALEEGYTSVMIDGSHQTFAENAEMSRRAAEIAHGLGIPAEAELGRVGGKEDDLECDADTDTDVEEAVEFLRITGIDSFAVAIGTAHGFYSGTPVLNKQRLKELRDRISVPLVLHGASGLSDKDISDCVKLGITKVNFATELRVAYTDGVRAAFKENPDLYDPKVFGKAGYESVKKLVKEKMLLLGKH